MDASPKVMEGVCLLNPSKQVNILRDFLRGYSEREKLPLVPGMCPFSSSGRAPARKSGDLGSNPGPDTKRKILNILI